MADVYFHVDNLLGTLQRAALVAPKRPGALHWLAPEKIYGPRDLASAMSGDDEVRTCREYGAETEVPAVPAGHTAHNQNDRQPKRLMLRELADLLDEKSVRRPSIIDNRGLEKLPITRQRQPTACRTVRDPG